MRRTRYYYVSATNPHPAVIGEVGRAVSRGRIVAFPTETVYGLGADCFNPRAVERIFRAKGRPADNPLIVHIASREELARLSSDIPRAAEALADAFWPGPLTLVVPRAGRVPDIVTAGLDTVAVRMPDHKVALALIRAAGRPLAAPSANTSGRPSPTTAAHVMADLAGKIDAVLDGGPAGIGVESTVLDLTGPVPVILRPGGITREHLEAVIGRVEIAPAQFLPGESGVPRSPGLKYRHYAPRGELWLVAGEPPDAARKIREQVKEWKERGLKVGVLASREVASYCRDAGADFFRVLGSRACLEEVAKNLYSSLRECDARGVEFILCETFPSHGLGLAVMNRLSRACGFRIMGSDDG